MPHSDLFEVGHIEEILTLMAKSFPSTQSKTDFEGIRS